MVKHKHKCRAAIQGIRRKSQTVPDQSLTIKQIVEKFVRGIGVDVKRHDTAYIDQTDSDLEKLATLGNVDKAYEARQWRDRVEHMGARLDDDERMRHEEERKRSEQSQAQTQGAPSATGLESLDNTRPVDTKQAPK